MSHNFYLARGVPFLSDFIPMKRSASIELFNPASKLKVDISVDLCYVFDQAIPWLGLQEYNSLLRLNRETNAHFKENWKLFITQCKIPRSSDHTYPSLHDRLLVAIYNRAPNATEIYQTIVQKSPPAINDTNFRRYMLNPINPITIKHCKFPSEWLLNLSTSFSSENLSLEFALQGYPESVIAKYASAYRYSDGKYEILYRYPTTEVNVEQVELLAKWHNLEHVIKQKEFASLVYNQRNFRLVKLYPKWQSVQRFIKYRQLPYTENDFFELDFNLRDIITCPKFGITPPVWAFGHFLDATHNNYEELKALLTREKLYAMHMTNISELDYEYKAFFKKVGIWKHILKIIIRLQIESGKDCYEDDCLSDDILIALPQCKFAFTSDDLKSCETKPSNYAIRFDQLPPIWILDILFKKRCVDTIRMEGKYYSVEKLLAISQ